MASRSSSRTSTGAGGTLGARRVAQAEPDGYTLLVHHIGMATSATLYRDLPYDPKTAFAPVGLMTEVPMTLVGRPDFPPNTLAELISYAKENGEQVLYAHAGIGAASQLCGMLLMQALDTQFTTVPYKGTGPAMTDLMGGQVDFMCDQTTNTTNPIKAGSIKAYAALTEERLDALPDLPTAAEAGLEGIDIAIWHGLYAPAGTPDEVVAKLSEALKSALADPTSCSALPSSAPHPSRRKPPPRRRSRRSCSPKSTAGSRSSRPPACTRSRRTSPGYRRGTWTSGVVGRQSRSG